MSHEQEWFFTDGSKIKDLPFSGFSTINANNSTCKKFRVSNKASIFSLEAIAIIMALKNSENSSKREIYIFSDSQSVLKGERPD